MGDLYHPDTPNMMGTLEAAKLHLQGFWLMGATLQEFSHFRA